MAFAKLKQWFTKRSQANHDLAAGEQYLSENPDIAELTRVQTESLKCFREIFPAKIKLLVLADQTIVEFDDPLSTVSITRLKALGFTVMNNTASMDARLSEMFPVLARKISKRHGQHKISNIKIDEKSGLVTATVGDSHGTDCGKLEGYAK